jgi:2-keto-4-pentenoate hydratase/2-oxohepta-3-ene-1,7-dioic acid hydratase in catechol pathway
LLVDGLPNAGVSFNQSATGQYTERSEGLRLVSVRGEDAPVLGVQSGDRWMPASELLGGVPPTMDVLVSGGTDAVAALRAATDPGRIARDGRPIAGAQLLAPVRRPGKVVAIGRNYREHADEEGVDAPSAPLIFAKWPSSIIGPGADIRWDPALTAQVDYEAELAVVIGREARGVAVADALTHVLGYTCLNDVSARDLQFGDGQWTRGKSLDTFCPMGPVLVTADEVGDPQALAIECRVNGEVLQRSSTSAMYFGVAEIISHCSMAFTLEPGDVIATGTPGGVGIFRDPPILLADGDVVEVTIERIGTLRNTCRHERVAESHAARAEAVS